MGLTAKRRDLRLLSGEALFAVAHDTERPFIVAAGPVKATALGTQFGVRLQPDGAKVVLLEGHVRVEPLTLKGLARVLPILAREELTPGQQLIAEAQNEMAIAVADTERSTSWRQGRLVFRGDALADAVAEFNRYSEHQIFVADPTLARLPVSGEFATAHRENFIAAVSASTTCESSNAVRTSPSWAAHEPRKCKTAASLRVRGPRFDYSQTLGRGRPCVTGANDYSWRFWQRIGSMQALADLLQLDVPAQDPGTH